MFGLRSRFSIIGNSGLAHLEMRTEKTTRSSSRGGRRCSVGVTPTSTPTWG